MQKEINGTYRWIGLGLGILSLFYFLNIALRQISSFPHVNWNLTTLLTFIGATILSAITILIGGYIWAILLRASGERVSNTDALVIFLIAQFARYIPGNIAHHAGRVALSKIRGFEIPRVLFTMTLETGCLIIAASILSMIWLMSLNNDLFNFMLEIPNLLQLLLILSIAIILPLLIGWILTHWRPKYLQNILGHAKISTPTFPVFFYCLMLYVLSFLIMGVISDILAQNLFSVEDHNFSLLTGAFAIAWVAGFLTPGAPAGLGIREAILLKLLGHFYGVGVAAGIALSLRVITTIADALVFVLAFLVRQKTIKSDQVNK
jgi:hypothetical protein